MTRADFQNQLSRDFTVRFVAVKAVGQFVVGRRTRCRKSPGNTKRSHRFGGGLLEYTARLPSHEEVFPRNQLSLRKIHRRGPQRDVYRVIAWMAARISVSQDPGSDAASIR